MNEIVLHQSVKDDLIEPDKMYETSTSSNFVVTELLEKRNSKKDTIEQVSSMILGSQYESVSSHFIAGNVPETHMSNYALKQFGSEMAIKHLDADYWSKLMKSTGVLEVMTQKRIDEWNKSIIEMDTPEFTREAVFPTLTDLFANKKKFFNERVENMFFKLSPHHKTNRTEGFYKRMILNCAVDKFGYPEFSTSGYIDDLRSVIASFMQRLPPKRGTSYRDLHVCIQNTGQWVTFDAGAMRIRTYKKGTAHIEVHPEIAWRLNCILNEMNEFAIPSQFRTPPKKKFKEFDLMNRPLPFEVLECLVLRYTRGDSNAYYLTSFYTTHKSIIKETIKVIESIGGVYSGEGGKFKFDYDPDKVLSKIRTSGCVVDNKTHQFYPTPQNVSDYALDQCAIEAHHSVLEPSAGRGDLVVALEDKSRLTCVEFAQLHCEILESRAMGEVIEADFLKTKLQTKFDRIIMNPPFSEGRAIAHIEKAYEYLANGGVLVAIAPSSLKDKQFINAVSIESCKVFDNEFDGTGVSVVVLKIIK